MSYVEKEQFLPEAQCKFHPGRSTTDMMFVIYRNSAAKNTSRCTCASLTSRRCFILSLEYSLWAILDRFGVPPKMISIISQFHDGMRACVRLDDR